MEWFFLGVAIFIEGLKKLGWGFSPADEILQGACLMAAGLIMALQTIL